MMTQEPTDPFITVVIPTFNRAELVTRAVASVLEQDETSFALVVVDDGSTDDTAERVRAIQDPRITVLRQTNQGVCSARNAGASACDTPLVTFLDSDDRAEAGWLRFFRQSFLSGARLASCGVRYVLPDGHIASSVPESRGPAFGDLRMRLLAGSFAIDRHLFFEIGGFRAGLRFSEHTDLGLRLGRYALDHQLVTHWTDRALVTTYRGESHYDPEVRFESAMTLLTEAHADLARDKRVLARYLSLAGVAASRLGRGADARSLLVRAVRTDPTAWQNYVRLMRCQVGIMRGNLATRRTASAASRSVGP